MHEQLVCDLCKEGTVKYGGLHKTLLIERTLGMHVIKSGIIFSGIAWRIGKSFK